MTRGFSEGNVFSHASLLTGDPNGEVWTDLSGGGPMWWRGPKYQCVRGREQSKRVVGLQSKGFLLGIYVHYFVSLLQRTSFTC